MAGSIMSCGLVNWKNIALDFSVFINKLFFENHDSSWNMVVEVKKCTNCREVSWICEKNSEAQQ
jgi:hypothetical protein